MSTAPDHRYPQEQMEDYQKVLAEVFEYAPLTLEAKHEFEQRLELAVGWRVADEMKETLEFLNGEKHISRHVDNIPVYTSGYGTQYVLSTDLLFSKEEQAAMVEEAYHQAKVTRRARRAALRRRKMLVNAMLVVALSTLLTSLYALGLGHDALGWFGLAGSLGLAALAHRAEEGR